MKQNTTPVVKVINGVHTFTNLNPDAKYFGLSEDDFYHLCLQLLNVVSSQCEHGRYPVRQLLEEAKAAEYEDGEKASEQICDVLMPDGCLVKDTLARLMTFLPNKADRRAVLHGGLLSEDDFFRMDVEDERYTGNYFDYDVDHRFSWSLNGMFFFEYAYDFEVANGI
ncbi:TPA: hypothetical protein L6L13_004250 [Escherichia coli]|nr:hypothetical protein [Escherichia coli]